MPVPNDSKVQTGTLFIPVPSDVYQVQIDDVEIRTGKKYMSDEDQEQYLFKSTILDEEHRGQSIGFFATPKWFEGGKGKKPSKFYDIVKAIYEFKGYGIDISNLNADDINGSFVNALIGKQVRITVKEIDGKNKVTEFMPIKIEVNGFVKDKPKEEVSDVGEDDIPF